MVDKVHIVGVGAQLVVGLVSVYAYFNSEFWLTPPISKFLLVILIIAALLGLVIGLILNQMIAYKRNEEVCVSGLPFPVHYGIPTDDGCISGYVSLRNLFLDLLYYIFFFMLIALTAFIHGEQAGFFGFSMTLFGFYYPLRWFLKSYLQIYPIKFVFEE